MPSNACVFGVQRDNALGKLDTSWVVGDCFIDDLLQVRWDGWSGFESLPDSKTYIQNVPLPVSSLFHEIHHAHRSKHAVRGAGRPAQRGSESLDGK